MTAPLDPILRRPGSRAFALVLTALAMCATLLVAPEASAGYTHYWHWHGRPDEAALRASVDEMLHVIEARRAVLVDHDGNRGADAAFGGTEVFGDAGSPLPGVAFNGIGEQGHETFGFPLAPFTSDNPAFQFTKTAYKPYDEVVTACLLVAFDHFPPEVLTIRSDGEWDEWKDGRALYTRVLGREPKNPFATRDEPGTAGGEDGPRPPGRSLGKNLLISALVFAVIALALVLSRRR